LHASDAKSAFVHSEDGQYIHLHDAFEGFAMNTTHHRYELSLARRGLLEIPDAAGVQVTCSEGCLWITLDNDPRDIVLEAGAVHISTEHRRALVYALEASTLTLRPQFHEADAGRAPCAPSISFMPRPLAA
jgi:DUF2917 family protein